ncbi:Adaptive-response sensory-kinase SasA [Dyadobacter sp. CECT 9275]|uniref:histidine kinase n=1 Tax=Dyadobacter helix TaxID=2822344 RepID=A0A916JDV9_9BACT|nr:PAS domain S-box protein [Dyadobacter sp. CECT 9275]CAG4995122.1 Adaptive-response sensory-kinase SasA [Dyadobacter sp. CECT 9275]
MEGPLRLKEIFNAMPVPSMVMLADVPVFTIVEANEEYLRLTGVSRENLLGKSFFEVFPENVYLTYPYNRDLFQELLDSKRGNKTPVFEFRGPGSGNLVTKTRHLVCTNTPVFDKHQQVEYILRSVTDMTEMLSTRASEKSANDSLVKKEKLLSETQQIARVGSWEANLLSGTLTWSDVVREIYEVTPDYIPSVVTTSYFYKEGENRDAFFRAVQNTIEHGTMFDLELNITTAKGNDRWVRVTGTSERREGSCTRLYGSVQDIDDRKIIERKLIESRNQFESLVQTVDGIVWEADAQTFEFSFVSDHVRHILGYSPEQWLSDPYFWVKHIHADDLEHTLNYCRANTRDGKNHTFDYRMITAAGNIVWIKDVVSVISEKGIPTLLRGVMVDITETKRFTELESLEKIVLELNSLKGSTVEEVLDVYLKGIEAIFPHMICSIHQVSNGRLQNWSSASLPAAYVASVENLLIGRNTGSCGTAAFLKRRVIVSDIENDIRWKGYKELALEHNLRACWSHPIINSEDRVVATFGIYYQEIKKPNEEELKVIDRSAAILRVILESRQSAEALEETSFLMEQGQELAHFGTWQWDIPHNRVKWSDTLYFIYGLDRHHFKATFEGYQELLHPEDKERVRRTVLSVLETRRDIVFEERIIRPNGEIRHLKSWGRLKTDEKGAPLKMIGACLDITDSKKIQEELLASEARLRSLVDAQTNYVMRIDLGGRYTYYNKKYQEDFGWIFDIDDLIGQDSIITVHASDRRSLREAAESCIRNPNKVYQIEVNKIKKGGGVRATLWHFVCLADSEGRPLEIQCTGLDVSDRKKMENALRISNERYEYVNKATNDAIYDRDLVRDHIAWGDGFHRMFGYQISDERYPMDKWKSLLHPADVQATDLSLKATLDDPAQHSWKAEYRFKKADGEYAFAKENGYLIRDRKGRAIRMIGVLRDITERKRTQLKLYRKSRLLAAIAEVDSNLLQHKNWFKALEQSFAIVGKAVDVDRAYYFGNQADFGTGRKVFVQQLEWNSGHFAPRGNNPELQEVSHKTVQDKMSSLMEGRPYTAIMDNLTDSDFKTRLIEQDIRSVMILPIFVKNKFYGYIGFDDCRTAREWDDDEVSFLKTIAVNVAKAIEIEEADSALLTAFEEKNKTLESIQDGFYALTSDFTVTYWNKEAENLLGIKREDIVNRNFWEVFHENDSSQFFKQFTKTLTDHAPVRFEEYHAPLDRWFEVSAFPAEAGLTVYFKNITERKLSEEKLIEMHHELEKHLKVLAVSNAELEQFAYVASHDLQEPLRMVTSFLTLLEKKYGEILDEKGKKYIFFAVDGARRMRQIILDLLDFSRVGKAENSLEKINLNTLIAEILTLYQKQIQEKKAKIKYGTLPTVYSFHTPLMQVFQNLISNGLKYQPEGQIPQITISSVETSAFWEFSVKDNGIGIDPQYFDKIFIIFQRLHGKDEYSGTGMGLAITKKIVENLGGKIWVESTRGLGSTFHFTIAKHKETTL